jgi:hypothetical protein
MNKVDSPKIFDIPSIGVFKYLEWPNDRFWFGDITTILPPNKVTFKIYTYNGTIPTEQQVQLIQSLPKEIETYLNVLWDRLATTYSEFTALELQKMFFLESIAIASDNEKLTFTLEAIPNKPSRFDGFKYFDVTNKVITKVTGL